MLPSPSPLETCHTYENGETSPHVKLTKQAARWSQEKQEDDSHREKTSKWLWMWNLRGWNMKRNKQREKQHRGGGLGGA
jgi:hypothetical protein